MDWPLKLFPDRRWLQEPAFVNMSYQVLISFRNGSNEDGADVALELNIAREGGRAMKFGSVQCV